MQNKLLIVFISLFFLGVTVSGQKVLNSPFARFNIGILQPEGSFKSLGMGGVGVAMRDNTSIYFSNPASYSSFDTLSFLFDFGVDYGNNNIAGNTSSFSSKDFNFHHLVLGFPVSRNWGVAVGIVPFSSGYYSLSTEVVAGNPLYDPNTGDYAVDHSGDGGLTKFFVGTGVKVTKNFSIGANMTFLSGQLTRRNQFAFADFATVFNNRSQESLDIHGLNLDYGIQYTASLKNNYFLNIGASISSSNNYKTKYNQLTEKFTVYGAFDTISYSHNDYARTFIPGELRFGVAFGKKNKFTTSLDYVTSKWSSLKIPGSTDYAADIKTVKFGLEYIPDKYSNYNFINRIEYRIGGHYGDNYLIINNSQLKEYGASVGLGIPLPRTASLANIYFDFTRKTGSFTSLHREDVITVGISLNLYDNWFVKRKYE